MALLADVFRDEKSRVTKTIVAIDLTNSTAMKEQQPEVQWLNTYAWFFDMLKETIETSKGSIVKYLGDGAMAVFDEDHPADAINWAIVVQELLAQAQQSKQVFCDCSIAITYGTVVEFDTPNAAKDYIGTVVDKAFRLCSVANAKAIFVDADTIIAAPMNRVQSRMGLNSMPSRTATQYQGTKQSVKVKGFSQPVEYHEILWASSSYDVRKEFVTSLSAAVESASSSQATVASPRATVGWSKRGRILNLSERFGFIRALDGEEFWFNADYLFRRSIQVKPGDEVWFNPLDPFPSKKSRRASDVLPLGGQLDGTIEKVITTKGFAFVNCTSDRHETKQIFLFVGQDSIATYSPGVRVHFTISENSQGLSGVQPRRDET